MLKYVALAAAFVSLGVVGSLNAQQTPPAPGPGDQAHAVAEGGGAGH
jgi:hypothetical protein